MTQPPTPIPEGSHRNRSIVIAVLLIGLVIGLTLGIFIGNVMLPTHTGVGTKNQAQVSGTVSVTQNGTISFDNSAEVYENSSIPVIQTSSPIVNGQYSVILPSGHSYAVQVSYIDSYGYSDSNDYTLYVPLGVTTFTANF